MRAFVFLIMLFSLNVVYAANPAMVADFSAQVLEELDQRQARPSKVDCGNYYGGLYCKVQYKTYTGEFCEAEYEYRGEPILKSDLCLKPVQLDGLDEQFAMIIRRSIEEAYQKTLYPYGGVLEAVKCSKNNLLVCVASFKLIDLVDENGLGGGEVNCTEKFTYKKGHVKAHGSQCD